MVHRCRLVGRCRCRLVGCVFGFTRVLNISNISRISIHTVSYSLDSAIGKGNVVASRGSISVTAFALSKVDSRVVISSGVDIIVSGGNIGVDRGGVVGRGGGISRWARGSNGSDKGSKGNKGLKWKKNYVKFMDYVCLLEFRFLKGFMIPQIYTLTSLIKG